MSDDLVKSMEDDLRIGCSASIGDTQKAVAALKNQAAEIARLRAALATARREGMEAMAGKIAGWHEARAEEWDDQENKFKKLKTISSFTSTNPGSDGLEFARQCAQAAAFHRQRAAAIRAAAKEGK